MFADKIEKILQAAFQPIRLEVTDQSQAHAGHLGARLSGGGHYSVLIVSEKFSGKNQVERHRAVYAALETELKNEIHALVIQAFAPNES